MKYFKCITAFIILLAFLPVFVCAETKYFEPYPYMDDVYRFDLKTDTDTAIQDKDTKTELLSVLGILEPSANKFLTLIEFSIAMEKINSGGDSLFVEKYKANSEKRNVTYREALTHLMGSLGYVVYVGQDEDAETKLIANAANIGLLKDVKIDALDSNIERSEFADLVMNALEIDMMKADTYSDSSVSYTVKKGVNILNERFSVYKVSGCLNAVQGLNYFSLSSPRKNIIEIDRAQYFTNNTPYDALLGRRVSGYFKYDEGLEQKTIIYLKTDGTDNAVTVDLDDITNFTRSKISYVNQKGMTENAAVSENAHFIYNGNLLADMPSEIGKNGTLMLSSTKKNSEYDLVVIKEYSDYVLKYLDPVDKLFFFQYRATFKGKESLQIPDNESTYCTIDGKVSDYKLIKPNDVISVIQNDSCSYTEIIASTATVEGSVEEIRDEYVIINGEEYRITATYNELTETSIALDSTGTFYLNFNGEIAGFSSVGSKKFGYLRAVGMTQGIDKAVQVKLFTQDGKWVIYDFAEKVEIDGRTKVGTDAAYNHLTENNILNSLVRYDENSSGKITFFDTLYDGEGEKDDEQRMIYNSTFSGKTRWNGGWYMGANNTYHTDNSTIMFVIPEDKNKEKQYEISLGSAIPGESVSNIVFHAYNADKFKVARVAIFEGSLSASVASTEDIWFWVEGFASTINDDEEYVTILKGKQIRRNIGVVEVAPIFLIDNWQELYPNLSKNDLVLLKLDSGRNVVSVTSKAENGVLPPDLCDPSAVDAIVIGTVVDVDLVRGVLLLNSAGNEISMMLAAGTYVVGIYYHDQDKIYSASVQELRAGDRIYIYGSLYRAYRMVVFR